MVDVPCFRGVNIIQMKTSNMFYYHWYLLYLLCFR